MADLLSQAGTDWPVLDSLIPTRAWALWSTANRRRCG